MSALGSSLLFDSDLFSVECLTVFSLSKPDDGASFVVFVFLDEDAPNLFSGQVASEYEESETLGFEICRSIERRERSWSNN